MSFPKPFNLDEKVALITGGANGLGLAFAEAMAEAGADVICADIDAKGLDEAVRKIKMLGRKAILSSVTSQRKRMSKK